MLLAVSAVVAADEASDTGSAPGISAGMVGPAEGQRIYRTREEQRAAGLQRDITPWLTLSGLLEGELQSDRYIPREGGSALKERTDNANLQFGLIADLFEFAEAEIVIEYDSDPDKFLSEEAFITFEFEPWDLSLGKQFTPLGLYFNRFVSGSMLEFGETSARHVALLTYGPSDEFDLSLAAYRGRSSELGEDGQWDWAIGFEAWPSETLSFGVSYQSDLSDSDERLLDDDHYIEPVPVLSAYLLGITDAFEFSLEFVAALDDFQELEKDRNRPMAWNAEVDYFFPKADLDLAFRIERSRELEDQPELRYGAAITWYPHRQASLTIEYLRGEFDRDSFSLEREDDIPIRSLNTMSARLTIEF
jgi:hypothetical protein